MIDSDNKYTKMQIELYKNLISKGAEGVVGNPISMFKDWPHMEELFKGFNTSNMTALDFGCGPGRNIVTYGSRFKRMDGVDLAFEMVQLANKYIHENNYTNVFALYECNGIDLRNINSNTYDFIMSTIALQHIAVWEIRYNYFKEFYRVLKGGGWISMQMGYGNRAGGVDYYANDYDAGTTNGGRDVMVKDENELRKDLEEIGFVDFSATITPVHRTDLHSNWIFFRARK